MFQDRWNEAIQVPTTTAQDVADLPPELHQDRQVTTKIAEVASTIGCTSPLAMLLLDVLFYPFVTHHVVIAYL